ncbi:MAG: DUF1700 domain-containing protein [Eubacteriales bacterium]
MRKEEFMKQLQMELAISLSGQVVAEHIRYYQEYIVLEMKKGRSEEVILAELGSPRLLAKSIIEANQHKVGGENHTNHSQQEYQMEQETGDSYKSNKKNKKFIKINGIIAIVILIGILILVARLFIYALPYVIIAALVIQVVKFLSSYSSRR